MSLHGDPGEPCCDLAPGRKVPVASLSPFVSPYLSTTLRRVSLPSTGRSRSSPGLLWGTEGSRVVGAPRLGGSARGHPGGWGRGTLGHAVLAPSSHLHCALRHGRGQSSLSPPCRRRRMVLSPPAFLGCHPPRPVSVGQSLPKPCCSRTGWPLSPPSPRQLTVSPGPVGAFWAGGPAGGPRPAPPLVPCAPSTLCSGCPQLLAGPGGSHPQPAPAAHTTGTTAPVKH